MVALKIEDIRLFTEKLFSKEDFDHFLVREISIVTFNRFEIDGHIRGDYYTKEERGRLESQELSAWRMLRPICFSLIKGKKLPGSFSIALQLRPDDAGNLIQKSGLGIAPETIQGLCLNIRYEDGRLMVTTATSLGFFTLDKSVDREWDEAVRRFFKEKEILYIEE